MSFVRAALIGCVVGFASIPVSAFWGCITPIHIR